MHPCIQVGASSCIKSPECGQVGAIIEDRAFTGPSSIIELYLTTPKQHNTKHSVRLLWHWSLQMYPMASVYMCVTDVSSTSLLAG